MSTTTTTTPQFFKPTYSLTHPLTPQKIATTTNNNNNNNKNKI
jgi:hypothetical protein